MPGDLSLSAPRLLDERQPDDDGDQASDIDDNVIQISEGHRRRSVRATLEGCHPLRIEDHLVADCLRWRRF
jgi:hypothetical protein